MKQTHGGDSIFIATSLDRNASIEAAQSLFWCNGVAFKASHEAPAEPLFICGVLAIIPPRMDTGDCAGLAIIPPRMDTGEGAGGLRAEFGAGDMKSAGDKSRIAAASAFPLLVLGGLTANEPSMDGRPVLLSFWTTEVRNLVLEPELMGF